MKKLRSIITEGWRNKAHKAEIVKQIGKIAVGDRHLERTDKTIKSRKGRLHQAKQATAAGMTIAAITTLGVAPLIPAVRRKIRDISGETEASQNLENAKKRREAIIKVKSAAWNSYRKIGDLPDRNSDSTAAEPVKAGVGKTRTNLSWKERRD